MFLVVGQPGSEARLVADALDGHPDLVVAGRGELLLPLAFLLQRVSEPVAARRLAADLIVADKGFATGIGAHLDADRVAAVLADAPLRLGPLLAELYGAVADAAGARRAGTMLSVLANPVLNRVGLYEGDVRLLHVVRDGRAVAAHAAGDTPGPLEVVRRWDQANRLFRDRRSGHPAGYALVRVEDFVKRPDREAARLAPLLGIEPGHGLAPRRLAPAPELDRATRRAVADAAKEGLFVFGYSPPQPSPQRTVIQTWRRARALRERRRRSVAHRRAQAWAREAPPPWTPETEDERVAPAACNICRWTGSGFTGQQHAESADCPRCGSIARERFHLHGLTPGPEGQRLRVLETAPRLHGTYAQAMARWFDYTELEPRYTGTPLGHLVGIQDLLDGSADRILSAHDLHTVPDPDGLLAELHRVLAPEGELLVQVPVLGATSSPLEAAETAAPGTARWAFGVDVVDRVAAAGFEVELLVTEEFADLVDGGPDGWRKATSSGEVDLPGVFGAAAAADLTPVADRATARRRGWIPAVLFVTLRARRG
ncbi:MAG TPA: methyltransferase domain-containing protein [Acidimicrobiales bacterium]|nr:methyltransferase domain-containing protein [Acidimicrobiales bacterium]